MALLPGVNVTNVISNAPGVLIRGTTSLPAKVRLNVNCVNAFKTGGKVLGRSWLGLSSDDCT